MRFPNGVPMERDARFQSLFYVPSEVPIKQGLLIKLNLIFLTVSPVNEPFLHGPPEGTLWTEFPLFQSQNFIQSFVSLRVPI